LIRFTLFTCPYTSMSPQRMGTSTRNTVPASIVLSLSVIGLAPGLRRGCGATLFTFQQAQLLQPQRDARSVGLVDPVGVRGGHLQLVGPTAGQHRLGWGELADDNGTHVLRIAPSELGVGARVMLPVVTDQHPADVGELVGQAAQLVHLVLDSAAEPGAGSGSP